MKFSALAIIATFASSALAATKSVYLTVKSDNPTIDGQGLSSIHEGAAINYVFLGSGGSEELVYESSNSTIYNPYIFPGYPFYLQIWGNILVVGVGETITQFKIDSSNYLTVNGSESGFYAVMNTNDPYNYSAYAYEALYYADGQDVPTGAIPFRIFVEDATSTTSSVAPSTTSSVATTTSAKPSIATAAYTNSSTTATTTAKNSTVTSTSPAQFTGAATVNQVSGALALGAFILAMLA
ncbi:hypothetical protein V1504DRAFT_463507 [Lipomyces starkeyi]